MCVLQQAVRIRIYKDGKSVRSENASFGISSARLAARDTLFVGSSGARRAYGHGVETGTPAARVCGSAGLTGRRLSVRV